ncbi:hypothetical protein BJ165DRAFT_1501348 [Panaeolus papilionaceus]|nr:hypothetical protein BJ165DRAFT_1501348 [Panaeolus papilionaceus]
MNPFFPPVQPPISLKAPNGNFIRIPQEIVDYIIGFLHCDPRALESCSLVCQAWHRSARPQLFHSLSLDCASYKRFFNLFQSSQLLPFTTYCRVLTLRHADWLFNVDGEGFREVVLHFSANLLHLSISQTTAPSFQHLIQALLPLRSLRSLTLDQFHFDNKTSSSSNTGCANPPPTPPLVDTLILRHTDAHHFFTCINASNAFDHLTDLHVDVMKETDFPALGKYLLPRRSQIEKLSFRYTCNYDMHSFQVCNQDNDARSPIQTLYRKYYGFSISPTLKQLSRLQQIRIENYLDCRQDVQSTALFWAPRVLASLSSHFTQHVVLTLHLDRAGQLDQYDVNWRFLDEIFNSETYVNLKNITFQSCGRADLSGLYDLLAARLPRSTDRRLLEVLS